MRDSAFEFIETPFYSMDSSLECDLEFKELYLKAKEYFKSLQNRGESQGALYQFNDDFPEYKKIIVEGASIFLLV